MIISMKVPQATNSEMYEVVFEDEKKKSEINTKELNERFREAKIIYESKDIYEYTKINFIDFLNINQERFEIVIKKVDYTSINL